MARILIAVSSIGLGHAARARVYGSLLEAKRPQGRVLRSRARALVPPSVGCKGNR